MREERLADFRYKLEILRDILTRRGAAALTLGAQNHFSWLTGGRGFVGTAATAACCTLAVTRDRVCLVTENIEAQRLWIEQTGENPLIEVCEYPWHQPERRDALLRSITGGGPVLTEADAESELFAARTVLTPYDISRYREICLTTARELEAVCRTLEAGMTEYELAGRLSERFWANDLEPITLLAGFDGRAPLYRHPVPVGAPLQNYALVAACTRRRGLIASVTRLVSLHRDEAMLARQRACARVDAALCLGTRPGADTADLFDACAAAYAAQGCEGEWRRHHQGGLTGYAPRELKAMPGRHHTVRAGEAYAWNPSVRGTKSENTILVTEDGFQNLTHTGGYPYLEVELDGRGVLIEDILILDEE